MNEDSLYSFLYNWYKDLIRPEDPYSVWDCYSESRNIYMELKCRRTHYDKLLIEKKQQEAEALKKIEERRKNRIEKMQRDAEMA